MKLVKNWRSCLKWFSVQLMLIAGAVQTTWATIPYEMQQSIPAEYVSYGTAFLMILGVIGRVIDQGSSEQ